MIRAAPVFGEEGYDDINGEVREGATRNAPHRTESFDERCQTLEFRQSVRVGQYEVSSHADGPSVEISL
jgi:hypothetical protein